MWKDVGLDDWLFDLDAGVDTAKLTAAVVGYVKDAPAAKAKTAAAGAFVRKRQAETMAVVGEGGGGLMGEVFPSVSRAHFGRLKYSARLIFTAMPRRAIPALMIAAVRLGPNDHQRRADSSFSFFCSSCHR